MQKIKMHRTADCVVGGFRYGEHLQSAGKRLVGSLLLGLYDDEGLLQHVGFTSGIKEMEKRGLTEKLEKIKAERSFTGNAPGAPSRWSTKRSSEWVPVRPKFVIRSLVRSFFRGAGSATVRRSFSGGRTKSDAMHDGSAQELRAEASGCRQSASPRGRKSGEILLAFFLWDALSFLSRLREPDSYGLLSAFDFTAFPAPATFRSAPFIATHLTFESRLALGNICASFSLPQSLLRISEVHLLPNRYSYKELRNVCRSGRVPK